MDAKTVLKAWRARLVKGRLPRAVGEATALLARRVRSNAPVASGDLRDSVASTPVRVTKRRISSAVVVASDHALAREYGTQDTDPDPYFRPAIGSELPRMKAIIRDAARS